MISRRRFITGFLIALTPLGATATAQEYKAQQASKLYSIGILTSAARPSPTYGPIVSSALRDNGYELGRNVALEVRYAAGRVEQLPDLAADLVRRKVDLVLAFGASESLAAMKATTTIPIVFLSPTPVELGLVQSLARPGGNLTGLSVDTGPAVVGKILESLRMVMPALSRVAVLVDPHRPVLAIWWKAGMEAGQALQVQLRMVPVQREEDLEAAFAMIAGDRPGALVLTADALVLLNLRRITDFALKHRLPTASYVRDLVDEGGLMSYGPNFGDLMRRAVSYVDKIFKGARPADLPIEQPTTFELVINLKTAKALGLTIPQSLLQRADQVIE